MRKVLLRPAFWAAALLAAFASAPTQAQTAPRGSDTRGMAATGDASDTPSGAAGVETARLLGGGEGSGSGGGDGGGGGGGGGDSSQ